MKTLVKWFATGVVELVFCFWLLGASANFVSAESNLKVWLGVGGYLTGLLVLPGASVTFVARRVATAKARQKLLRETFPEDDTTLLQLLDSKRLK